MEDPISNTLPELLHNIETRKCALAAVDCRLINDPFCIHSAIFTASMKYGHCCGNQFYTQLDLINSIVMVVSFLMVKLNAG